MSQINAEETRNRLLYLISKYETSCRKATQGKVFFNLFSTDPIASFVAGEFLDWFRQYETIPSMQKIYEKHKESSWGAKLKIRFKILVGIGESPEAPTDNEFGALVDDLRLAFAKEQFSKQLQSYANIDPAGFQDADKFCGVVKDFGKKFVNISNDLVAQPEGEYSYTTHQARENVGKILIKDTSNEKRFKIGHRKIDEALHGFRYGDMLLVLGNINAGKSMVLTNIAYNLWRDGANVLLLTAEMRPTHFDDRIYSRAAAVSYTSIMNGKSFLTEQDKVALESCVKYMETRDNHIITKYLPSTDHIATIEGYINDLKLERNFVPDVVIFDSLEHISPLDPPDEEKDWQNKGQIITEFKNWAETAFNGRGVFVISTHQAKTEAHGKKFDDISLTDFGRSKVVPEKADYAMYIRTMQEFKTLNVKLVKARFCPVGMTWSMGVDYSICLVADTEDEVNSESFIDDDK